MFEKIPSQESLDLSKYEALVGTPRPESALTRGLVNDALDIAVEEINGPTA